MTLETTIALSKTFTAIRDQIVSAALDRSNWNQPTGISYTHISAERNLRTGRLCIAMALDADPAQLVERRTISAADADAFITARSAYLDARSAYMAAH